MYGLNGGGVATVVGVAGTSIVAAGIGVRGSAHNRETPRGKLLLKTNLKLDQIHKTAKTKR